ncbi:MAG: hypothetical protein Terrestrivirus9_22 [Terrestrivirus sp.]|uniref:Uncharacterized protein n=1 Tax=Terrestrivirus sp. TaxID=2487775 RepID=A0A3G4ZNY3_9VIRU|nr:MAG: hypothetical protein Terrestrivirus9_22 [Terrestrivirus sp.]
MDLFDILPIGLCEEITTQNKQSRRFDFKQGRFDCDQSDRTNFNECHSYGQHKECEKQCFETTDCWYLPSSEPSHHLNIQRRQQEIIV